MAALDPRPVKERILSSISKPDGEGGCWVWQGVTLPRGYGQISVHSQRHYAHRLSYETFVGPIPDGLDIMHLCDNPSCVNPAHLTPGTRKRNMNDASLKGRVPHGERHWGAKLTEDKARELIAVRDRDGLSYRNLAKLFGISTMQACRICTGKRWAGLSRKEDE